MPLRTSFTTGLTLTTPPMTDLIRIVVVSILMSVLGMLATLGGFLLAVLILPL